MLGENSPTIQLHESDNICLQIHSENIEEFKQSRKENYSVTDIIPGSFITTKYPQTHVFLVTFQQQYLPHSIYLPGERQDTRIFKTKYKSLMCNNCLQHGHPKKYDNTVGPMCKKCASSGYGIVQCSSENERGINCNEAHLAGRQ